MSGVKNFVSENELEEARRTRQAEWDKVRKPEDPVEVPEQPQDTRCLYERLKVQRGKQQMELEEAQRLKHMVRGLDSEEVGFLDYVDEMKAAEEKQRRLEEKQIIQEITRARETDKLQEIPATSSTNSATIKKAAESTAKSKLLSKQAQLISSSIIKRRSAEENSSVANETTPQKKPKLAEKISDQSTSEIQDAVNEEKLSTDKSGSTLVLVGQRPVATKTVGILPGLSAYSCGKAVTDNDAVSDSSNSSDSSSDELSAETDCAGLEKRRIIIEIKSRTNM